MKTVKSLERVFKGVANHRRIEIILMLKKNPDMILMMIAQKLDCNLKTIAEHTRRLVIAGLVNKTRMDNMVLHNLSPYGEKAVKILKEF